jgi:hypothetical protein
VDILLAHLTELMLAVIAAILARAVPWARAMLEDWLARQRLESALGRAAGLILADPQVQARGALALEQAVEVGRAYLRDAIPDTLRRLGVTEERLLLMLRGEAGKRLGGEW